MNASIDTDIVIHLYGSGKEELIFHFFDQLYMHAYLYEQELKVKAALIYLKVSADVERGRIKIISSKDLASIGIQSLFERYKRDYEYLFDSGELYSDLNLEEMHREFDSVTSKTMNRYPMKFRTKMMMTARRFSQNHGTKRDYYWVKQYCQEKNIDYRVKMRELKKYLTNIE